jgi:hypothetical protein
MLILEMFQIIVNTPIKLIKFIILQLQTFYFFTTCSTWSNLVDKF